MTEQHASERAIAAYEALLALDSEGYVERAELRAAGVSASAIASLYPATFPYLTLHIIEHLQRLSDQDLLDAWQGELAETARTVWDGLPKELDRLSDADSAEDDRVAEQITDETLFDYLTGRFVVGLDPNALDYRRKEVQRQGIGKSYAWGIWAAYWHMGHRNLLPQVNRERAERLMMLMAEAIHLHF